MNDLVPATGRDLVDAGDRADTAVDYVTVVIADQLFGIPVLQVQDVLAPQEIAPVPLAPSEVAGSLNLRGRIVTAIDVRRRLGLPRIDDPTQQMSVVVDHGGELYSLIVDTVGEVLSMDSRSFERNISTLDPVWREVSCGIYRLEDRLLVVLEVSSLLHLGNRTAA